MKKIVSMLIITLFFCSNYLIGQEKENKEIKRSKTVKLPDETSATGDVIEFKDDEDNTLLKVTDEGSFGSVDLRVVSPPQRLISYIIIVGLFILMELPWGLVV